MGAVQVVMTREEAIDRARKAAEAQGWPWEGPIRAALHKPSWIERLFEKRTGSWGVFSNINMRGANVRILLDDESGEILGKWFAPRETT